MDRARNGGRRTERRHGWGALALGAALLIGAAGARPAGADGCEDCEAPSGEALQAAAGFTLEERDGFFGRQRDVVETDGGACSIRLLGPPKFEMVNSYLVLMGSGEVWNCPGSSSCDTMSVSYEDAASTEWSQTSDVGASLGAYGVGLSASLKEMISRAHTIRVVSSLSKNQCATWCHRIRWEGYFEVGTFTCTVSYAISRDFAWWTKNPNTGDKVHQSGHIQVECGTGTATFTRQAPINALFRLSDSVCDNLALCAWFPTKDLGFFPKQTPITPTPPIPTDPGTGTGGGTGGGHGEDEDEGGGAVTVQPPSVGSTADLPEAPTGPIGDPLSEPIPGEPLPEDPAPAPAPTPEPTTGSAP